jgi:hypothetical protein
MKKSIKKSHCGDGFIFVACKRVNLLAENGEKG